MFMVLNATAMHERNEECCNFRKRIDIGQTAVRVIITATPLFCSFGARWRPLRTP